MRYFRNMAFAVLAFAGYFNGNGCTGLNTPTVQAFTYTNSILTFSMQGGTTWGCAYSMQVEIACASANFTGLIAVSSPTYQYSSPPYSVPAFTYNTSGLCPGVTYKFRVRESYQNSQFSINWSNTYTFTTPGVPIVPTLSLSASPNVICPPATNQLSATVNGNCGGSNTTTYSWSPATGLSSATIANPIATVTNNTTYTCTATGGQLGCWTATNSITLNLGTSPPVGGTAVASPTSICLGKTVTLSVSGFSGNIQWQSSSNSSGPWTNVPGANNSTYVTPPINSPICYQVLVNSCSGTVTATSNVVCINTNLTPVISPSTGCSSTLSTASFTYTGSSGTHTAVAWSPAPVSLLSSSTQAFYNSPGIKSFTVYFPDGCISTSTVSILQPSLSFATNSISCSTLGSATVYPVNMPVGPYSYYWLPSSQSSSVATGLFPNVYTVSASFGNGNCAFTGTVNFPSSSLFYGNVSNTTSLSCFGVNNGTAAISMVGGTGNYNYNWTNGSSVYTTATVNNLGAGTYTVYVSDQITFCAASQIFLILQPPPVNVTVTASSPTACAGLSALLSATASGGTSGPGFTYSWTSGPATSTYAVSQATGGSYIYTVTAFDGNNCAFTANQLITFVNPPVISVSDVSICPGKTGTLTASGATTYTWTSNNSNAFTFTANPVVNTQYTVVGMAQSCTSAATASMLIKPVPVPTLTSNSPVCNGQILSLNATGGVSYFWYGPVNYTSTLQSPNLNPVSANYSGIFTVIATAANSCTGSVTGSVTIYPTPTILASGDTVCTNGIINLSASSFTGSTFLWTGPNSFNSNTQNPTITPPLVSSSGNYTVKVTSAHGCTNTAVVNVTVTAMPVLALTNNSPRCFGSALNLGCNTVPGATYSWNGPNAFLSSLQSPIINTVTLPASGVYNVYVALGPCLATASTAVLVNPLPVPNIISNSPVCETKSLALSVSGNSLVSYLWKGPVGFLDNRQNAGRDSCKIAHSGNYTVIVTDANSCSSYSSIAVSVLKNPTVSAVSSTVCFKTQATLKASGAASYAWYVGGVFYSNQTNAVINLATNVSPVIYTVIGTALNTCTSVATATLATLPLPVPSVEILPSNHQVCLNSVVTLKGHGAFGYDWVGPGQFLFSGETVSFAVNSTGFSGTYTMTAKDENGCRASTTTNLLVNDLPGGSLGGVMKGCVPLASKFRFYPSAIAAKIVNTTWSFANAVFPTDTFRYTFNVPGDYLIKGLITDINNCVNTSTYLVNAYAKPVANFSVTPEKPIEGIDDVTFINTSTGEKINQWCWYVDNENNEAFGSNRNIASFYFGESGNYVIAMVVKNEYGCADSIVKILPVADDFNVFVPDVFSPNGDGTNEIFIPVTRGIKLYNFTIYNRWGMKIFETNDLSTGWDGTTGGKASPEGVYIWHLNVSSIHGDQKELRGHVTLFR